MGKIVVVRFFFCRVYMLVLTDNASLTYTNHCAIHLCLVSPTVHRSLWSLSTTLTVVECHQALEQYHDALLLVIETGLLLLKVNQTQLVICLADLFSNKCLMMRSYYIFC